MKVSVITPTKNRPEMLERCKKMFLSQDYRDKEWHFLEDEAYRVISSDGRDITFDFRWYRPSKTIGGKRNNLCYNATGEIILHMDDDDIYAPDWITRSVKALTESNGNLTGLRRAYFKSDTQTWLYDYPVKAQAYVVGATMCYYRSMWEKNPFQDISRGEDTIFASRAIIRPHDYIEGFTAILHGGNTASHLQLESKEFTLVQ